jgi:hypothetical protein
MIPLYGFLQGDTIGLLVLAYPDDTMLDLTAKLKAAASVRVAPKPGGRLFFRGVQMDARTRVADAGLEPLDRIDVRWEEV